MKKRNVMIGAVVLFCLVFTGMAKPQNPAVIRDTGVVVDTPTVTIAGVTVDTTPTASASAHSVIVQFKFGTVVGSYSACTVQAKTSIDGGASYLTLSTAASITATTGTANTWMVTDKGPASGNTSTPSTSASIGFGQLTKFTFACSGYGTSAPVTVTTIYGTSPIGGASSGGGGGGAITAGNGDIVPLGSTTDDRCTATDTTAEGMVCLLKQVVYLLGHALTVTDGSGAINVIVDSSAAITANAGTNLNTSALALEAGNLASLLTSLGATGDASVAAGATGSVEAKLRRATQGLEDLKSLIVLAPGANQIGTVLIKDSSGASITAVTDPCNGLAKTPFNISFASTTAQVLVSATGSVTGHICSIKVNANAAEVVSLIDGTQSSAPCDSGTPIALDGSTTAANGNSLAANGGWAIGTGNGTLYKATNTNRQICAITSGSNRVVISGTYVKQ